MATALICCCLCAVPYRAAAQKVTATPALDVNRFMGVWYVLADYPSKWEKHCAGNITELYALGDKLTTFQMGNFCPLKNGSPDNQNFNGKIDKTVDGRLKLRWFFFLTHKYWVLAIDPNYQWALTGTPNHKQLLVLSRSSMLPPETLAQIESIAAAQGFRTAKLQTIAQNEAPKQKVAGPVSPQTTVLPASPSR